MKIKCSIIQDILPLYAENIVSDDTKELVETHLSQCDNCKNELNEMIKTENIPMDINSIGLENLKAKLSKNKFKSITFSVMITLIISILVVNLLTQPIYKTYSEDLITISTNSNGLITADFNDTVSDFHVYKSLSEDGLKYDYGITVWDTYWDRLISSDSKVDTFVFNPNNESVDYIDYYSAGQSDNVVIYGNGSPYGIGFTYARLTLNYYFILSLSISTPLFLVFLLSYKFKKFRYIVKILLFIPISYIIGHILIHTGLNAASYLPLRDFIFTISISIPIYFTLILGPEFYNNYRLKNTL